MEFLATQQLPRSQAEIALGLERSPNEIYRMLVGLELRGYIERDETSGKYRISLKIYNLSRKISPVDKVRQCALPHMEDFAFSTGYSCYLSMLYKSQTMVIVHASAHSPISLTMAEGTLFTTLSNSSGKVLLANSNDDVRDMILERDPIYQNLSQVRRSELISELVEIKESGYLCEPSNLIQGVDEIAALIGRPNGTVVASLAVAKMQSPVSEFKEVDTQELINKLKEAANNITAQLGS